MEQLSSKSERRALSWILAVVLLLASVPLCSGVVIVAGPTQPEFTLNICHPIQPFDQVTNILLARSAPISPQLAVAESGPYVDYLSLAIAGSAEAPDPPPPKLLV
jgi:hypothetical protein